jgi:hypothetical protein
MMSKKKKNEIIIHSSAAEYLTYAAASGGDERSFEMRYENENVWLTQKMMAALYVVDVRTINDHIKKVFADDELSEASTIRNFRIVQSEGSRQVERDVKHYNLQMIIAVGFKVNNENAVHRHTAAELIVERADANKEHMGLTTWETAPHGKIIKTDISIAKNYLNDQEMNYLERIVSLYLDFAELQAERHIPMTMNDWAKRLDGFLEFNGNEILIGAGKISHEQAKLHAETEFEKYRIVQDRLFESDFDRFAALEQSLEVIGGGDDE